MRRPCLLVTFTLLLIASGYPRASGAVDAPITYLEREPASGRFFVKYDGEGTAVSVAPVEAITAPSLSPDGSRIAFSGVVGNGTLGLYAIYTVNVDGSRLSRITNGNFAELDPAWSPDGTAIVYSQNNTASYGPTCCRIGKTVIGGATTYLTGAAGAKRPEYSADGGTVAYDTPTGVFTIPANGGTARIRAAGGFDPTFSPDGNYLAFIQKSGSNHLVRKVNLSSGVISSIYVSSLTLESPVWTGGRVLFIEHAGSGYDGRTSVRIKSVPENGGAATTEHVFLAKVAELDTVEPITQLVGDVNGDLRDDVVVIDAGTRGVLRSTSSKFVRENWGSVQPAGGWSEHLGGQFNGDNRFDTAGYRSSDGTWHTSLAGSSSFTTSTWADFSSGSGWLSRSVGDFNNDGRDDIAQYHPSNGTWWVSKSTGAGFSTTLWADFSTATGWTSQIVGDFNGDGKDDIANYHPGNGTWWISGSTGSRFATSLWADYSTATGWSKQIVGDFNGDGRDDIANYHPSNGTWWVSRSTGTEFVTNLWADFSTAKGWTSQIVGDFNGDGRDDIANYHPGTGTWWVSRSTGSGFSTSLWDAFSTATGWTSQIVGDFTGDGRDDIANYHPGNGTWWISRSTGTSFATTKWAG